MNETSLAKILDRELSNINQNDYYRKLFTINNNLDSFNIINRALILGQYPKAFDVRSRLQWSIAGKNIKTTAKPIFVMNPITDSTYRFSDDGTELRHGTLNPIEISNSLKMGLLVKDTSIIGISIDGLFDIRDTEYFDKDNCITSDNLKVNLFNLLIAVENLMDVEVNKIDSGNIQYFPRSKQLFIPRSSYRDIVSYILNIMIDFILENRKLYDNKSYTKDINKLYYKLIEETAKFSVKTKFGIIDNVDFSDSIKGLDRDTFIEIAKEVDSVVCIITSMIPSDSGKEVRSAAHSIRIAKQAENLVDIMESNLVNLILNE